MKPESQQTLLVEIQRLVSAIHANGVSITALEDAVAAITPVPAPFAGLGLGDGIVGDSGGSPTGKFYKDDGSWATPTGLQVSNTPAGTIAATTVQAALNELDTEKLATTGTAADSTKLGGTTPSAYGLTIIDDVDAATARTTLGLGSAATKGGYTRKGITLLTSGSGATYSVPANVTALLVEVQGPGGGGGGAASTASNSAPAGGGGAGSYASKFYTSLAGSYTYTVGAGGTGGSAGNNAGNNGTANTVFDSGGTPLTGKVGTGGSGSAAGTGVAVNAGGAGGAVGLNGDQNGGGQPGQTGCRLNGTTAFSGMGGSAGPYGGGGQGRVTEGAGNNAVGYGAGGGGALSLGTSTRAGGNGASGFIRITEFY